MKQVTVVVHREELTWWAESPDLDGWSVAAQSRAALDGLVREAIAFHLGVDDDGNLGISMLDAGPADPAFSEGA